MTLSAADLRRFEQAESALSDARYRDARDHYAAYLRGRMDTVRDGNGFRAPDAVAIERLAELSSHLGDERAAEELLIALAGLYRRAGNGYGEQFARLRTAYTQLRRGDIRRAYGTIENLSDFAGDLEQIEISSAGLRRWEETRRWPHSTPNERSLLLSLWYLLLGRLFAANGRYGSAVTVLDRGLEQAAVPEAAGYQNPLRFAAAQAKAECGDFAGAERALEKTATDLASPETIAMLELSGHIEWWRGDLGAAKNALEEAVRMADAFQLPGAVCATRLHLANILILVNQTEAAQELVGSALRLARSLGLDQLEHRALSLDQLIVLRRRSQATIAPSVFELQMEAAGVETEHGTTEGGLAEIPRAAGQDSYLGTFDDRVLELHDALARNRLAEARTHLARIEAFANSDSPLVSARLNVARGVEQYAEGNAGEASLLLANAQHELTRLGMKMESRQVHRYQLWCATRLRDGQSADEHRRAEAALLALLSDSLKAEDQGLFWLNKWTTEEEGLSEELNGLVRLQAHCEQGSRLGRRWRWLRLWWRLVAFLDKLDRYRDAKASQAIGIPLPGKSRTPPRWWRLMRFPRQRATLSFLVLPDRVFAGCTWRFGGRLCKRPLTRLALREMVRDFHTRVIEFNSAGPERESLETIANACGLPELFSALPASVTALHFVPDDALHGVPCAALRFNGKAAVDRWAVSNARGWFPEVCASKPSTVLVAAAPNPGGEFRELAGALGEITFVGDLYRAVHVETITGTSATRVALSQALAGKSLFHAACHGVFLPKEPGASGLVLREAGGKETLTLRDIAALDLCSLRLAFLASCWLANDFMWPGRFVVSLPGTFLLAGAKTVVASLWEVLDEIAPRFVERFYTELKKGTCRDEAVRRAMQACRYDSTGQERPLADWAGFVLYGATGRFQ